MRSQVGLLIGVVLCINIARVTSVHEYDLGPVSVAASYGSLPPKSIMTQDDIDASNSGIARMEYLRRFMEVGVGFLPPLDPYRRSELEPVVLNTSIHDEPVLRGSINLRNLKASGAKRFSLVNLEIRLEPRRLDFEVTVPEVHAQVDFDAENFNYDGFVINFSGHLDIHLTKLNFAGAQSLGNDESVSVDGLHVESKAADVKCELSQPEDADGPAKLPESVMSELTKAAADAVVRTAVKQLDEIVNHYNIEQLLAFLKN